MKSYYIIFSCHRLISFHVEIKQENDFYYADIFNSLTNKHLFLIDIERNTLIDDCITAINNIEI